MSVIAVGDVTTQLRKWIDTNAVGGAGNSVPFDTTTKMRAPLVTATGEPTASDLTMLVRKFIVK